MKACRSTSKPPQERRLTTPSSLYRPLAHYLPNTLLNIIPPLLYYKLIFFQSLPRHSLEYMFCPVPCSDLPPCLYYFNYTKLESSLIFTTRQQFKLYFVSPGYKNVGKGYKNFSNYEQISKSIFRFFTLKLELEFVTFEMLQATVSFQSNPKIA